MVTEIAGVRLLLGAGGGSRYQGEELKLRALVADKPLVSWALRAMVAGSSDPCAIVVGQDSLLDLVPPDVVILSNSSWEQGMATSLAVGIDWANSLGARYVVVGLADQPGATESAWARVQECHDVDLAFAEYEGRRGHPVRIAKRVFSYLPRTGDMGARQLFAETSFTMRGVAVPGIARDLDTVEDRNWLTMVMAKQEGEREWK